MVLEHPLNDADERSIVIHHEDVRAHASSIGPGGRNLRPYPTTARVRPGWELREPPDMIRPGDPSFLDVRAHGFAGWPSWSPRFGWATQPSTWRPTSASSPAPMTLEPSMRSARSWASRLHLRGPLLPGDAAPARRETVCPARRRDALGAMAGAPSARRSRWTARLFNCARDARRRPRRRRHAEGVSAELTASSTSSAGSSRLRSRAPSNAIDLLGITVPFGTDVPWRSTNAPGFVLHRDLPRTSGARAASTIAALSGATVLANLSASNVTIGRPTIAATWSA